MRPQLVPVLLAFALTSPAWAQQPARPHVDVPTVAPRPEDVATLDGIMKAFL